ncbi:MAG: hypothetical protein N2Z70_07735 [Bdellovibrionaceae bacterium]|nr:hypothetical protein [Pseudobdellovibrionaceae bacterium]
MLASPWLKERACYLRSRFWAQRIIGLSMMAMVGSCAHWGETPLSRAEKSLKQNTYQRIFVAPYDKVWRACTLSLPYPLAMSNSEEGLLETEWMDSVDGFQPFHRKDKDLETQFRIRVLMAQGKSQGKPSVRVTIVKEVRYRPNFFNSSRPAVSDGIEEEVIFYRMARELAIEKAIQKMSKAQ